MYSQIFQIRNRSQVPFYCHPLNLFIAVWAIMLASLKLRISYTTYPDFSLAVELFLASFLSYLFGYATIRAAYMAVGYRTAGSTQYRVNLAKLRRVHFLAGLVVVTIVIVNLRVYGLPPIFGVFGADTLDYLGYGSLKQAFYPALMVLFVSAPLEMSWFRRWLLYLLPPALMLAYVSRGLLLITLFQGLLVFSLRTTLNKKTIYAIALLTLGLAAVVADVIGNNRSSVGSQGLLLYLQIKRVYYDWPTPILWIVSYLQTSISNLCWIVRAYHYDHPSGTFLYSLLPGFLSPPTLEATDLGSANIVDGVHTYIAKYYLDLWIFGIFAINYVWGLISAYINTGDRLTRNYLISATLLGCLGFIFFIDYLSTLTFLLELGAMAVIQRYVTSECRA